MIEVVRNRDFAKLFQKSVRKVSKIDVTSSCNLVYFAADIGVRLCVPYLNALLFQLPLHSSRFMLVQCVNFKKKTEFILFKANIQFSYQCCVLQHP